MTPDDLERHFVRKPVTIRLADPLHVELYHRAKDAMRPVWPVLLVVVAGLIAAMLAFGIARAW